jgi:hypothetical protein
MTRQADTISQPKKSERRPVTTWTAIGSVGTGMLALASFALCGCDKRPPPTVYEQREEMKAKEYPESRPYRWRQEAPESVRKECTNAVVGFHRVVEARIDDYPSNNPKDWSGYAVVEFVNKVGGIERTNLPFFFGVTMGDVYAAVDTIWFRQVEARDFELEMAPQVKEQKDDWEKEQWAYHSNGVVEAVAKLEARQPKSAQLFGIDSSRLRGPKIYDEKEKKQAQRETDKINSALDQLDKASDSELSSAGLPNRSETRRQLLMKLKDALKVQGVEAKFVVSPEGKLTLEPQ